MPYAVKMETYVAYNGHVQNMQPRQASLQHEDFDFCTTAYQHHVPEYRQSSSTHEYFASPPLAFVPTSMSQVILTNSNSAPDHQVYYNHGLAQPAAMHDTQIYSPDLQSSGPISRDHTSPDVEDWTSQATSSRTHSITPFDDAAGQYGGEQPYYNSSQALWVNQAAAGAPPLASPPISQGGGSFVAPTEVEQPSIFNAGQTTEELSDIDADGEDEDELTVVGGFGVSTAPKYANQQDPLTPKSDSSYTQASSEDEMMSDNGSEYKPGVSNHKASKSRRQSTTTVRSGRVSRKQQDNSSSTTKASNRNSPSRTSKKKINSAANRASPSDLRLRPFYCPFAPFGCLSTFPNKNEWKRHAMTQHLQQYFWRCNLCPEEPDIHNDFNRKDLYEQHVQRMHREVLELDLSELSPSVRRQLQLESKEREKGIDKEFQKGKDRLKEEYWLRRSLLQDYEMSCRIHLRNLPTSCICPISTCDDKEFRGHSAWDERMEHMSIHFNDSRRSSSGVDGNKCRPAYWLNDVRLMEYLEVEGLITQDSDGSWTLVDTGSRR